MFCFGLGLVWFYVISTIVGYVRPNPFYAYILNIYALLWFWFYGISTIVGYVMPNPFYTYMKYMISKLILLITYLNKTELIILHTIKWFHLISNNSV